MQGKTFKLLNKELVLASLHSECAYCSAFLRTTQAGDTIISPALLISVCQCYFDNRGYSFFTLFSQLPLGKTSFRDMKILQYCRTKTWEVFIDLMRGKTGLQDSAKS